MGKAEISPGWRLADGVIAVEKRLRLGHVESTIEFETPGIHTDREIVSKEIAASEIEVDHAGNGVVQEQDIVGKEIRVNDAPREMVRPLLGQGFKRAGKAR